MAAQAKPVREGERLVDRILDGARPAGLLVLDAGTHGGQGGRDGDPRPHRLPGVDPRRAATTSVRTFSVRMLLPTRAGPRGRLAEAHPTALRSEVGVVARRGEPVPDDGPDRVEDGLVNGPSSQLRPQFVKVGAVVPRTAASFVGK